MQRVLLLPTTLFSITVCVGVLAVTQSSSETPKAAPEGLEVIRHVSAGHLTRTLEPAVYLIRSQADLDRLDASYLGNGIDFSHESLAIVTAGQMSSTGYGINITHVVPTNDELRARVSQSRPRAGQIAGAAITYPHSVVAVENLANDIKQITLEDANLRARATTTESRNVKMSVVRTERSSRSADPGC